MLYYGVEEMIMNMEDIYQKMILELESHSDIENRNAVT